MKHNGITHTLSATALVASLASIPYLAYGKVQPVDVSFQVVKTMVLTQVSPVAFGANLLGTANSICTLTAEAWPTANVAVGGMTAAISDGIAGAGCIDDAAATTNSYSGVYSLKSAVSSDVKITLSVVVDGDDKFLFKPTGRAGNIVAGLTAGSPLVADVATTIKSDSGGDIGIQVGGILTIGSVAIPPEASLSQSFFITAVY